MCSSIKCIIQGENEIVVPSPCQSTDDYQTIIIVKEQLKYEYWLSKSVECPRFPGVGWWVSPIARLTSQKKGRH